MRFHPRLAPIKAGVFPLVNKEGMPEIAEKLYRDVRRQVGPAQFGAVGGRGIARLRGHELLRTSR